MSSCGGLPLSRAGYSMSNNRFRFLTATGGAIGAAFALLFASTPSALALPLPTFSGSAGTSYFDESTSTYHSVTNNSPGGSGSQGGSAATSASVSWNSALGLVPKISASGSVNSLKALEAATANINLFLDYYMTPVGPANTKVPLIASGSGAVTGSANASLGVFPVGPPLDSQPAVVFAGYQNWNLNTTFLGLAGQVYQVQLNVQFNLSSTGQGSFAASALADPTFTIDPSFPNANLYHLEFSPGIGAVPEPGTFSLFATGLAGFGWLVRRRRKQTTRSERNTK